MQNSLVFWKHKATVRAAARDYLDTLRRTIVTEVVSKRTLQLQQHLLQTANLYTRSKRAPTVSSRLIIIVIVYRQNC